MTPASNRRISHHSFLRQVRALSIPLEFSVSLHGQRGSPLGRADFHLPIELVLHNSPRGTRSSLPALSTVKNETVAPIAS
jgi:hypothetical protein